MSFDFKNIILCLFFLVISVQKELKRETSTDEAATTIQKGMSDEE